MTSCPRCGSPRIVRNAHLLDRAHLPSLQDLGVAVHREPGAVFFKDAVSTPLRARVCGACGYTELYAEDPGALLAAAAARGEPGDPPPPPPTRRAAGDPDACLQCGAPMPGVDTCGACGWTYAIEPGA